MPLFFCSFGQANLLLLLLLRRSDSSKMANKVYKQRRSSIDHRQISSTTKTSNETLEDDEYLLPEKPIYSSTSSTSSSISSSSSKSVPTTITTDTKYKWSLVYRNILLMTVIHGLGIYGVCLIPQGSIATLFWIWLILIFGAIGIQTGKHTPASKTFKNNSFPNRSPPPVVSPSLQGQHRPSRRPGALPRPRPPGRPLHLVPGPPGPPQGSSLKKTLRSKTF